MSTALDNTGHNCNVVTQAESLVMAKEHVVEHYGTLRYTIGIGCSGGSLAQQWVANAYPGIYDGILPTCSFPDAWSAGTQVVDYHLLRPYFEDAGAVGAGHRLAARPVGRRRGPPRPRSTRSSATSGYFSAIVPTHACGGVTERAALRPADATPAACAAAIADFADQRLRPAQAGGLERHEKKLGHGFAGVAVDNVGVQYGLGALQDGLDHAGAVRRAQRQVGGLSIDIEPDRGAPEGRPAGAARAYRSGMINETNNLDRTAIIDCRGPDPGAAHDSYRAFAIRARLDREHGDHANQLIWEGPFAIVGDTQCAQNSLIAMDRWLAAVEKDRPRARRWPQKSSPTSRPTSATAATAASARSSPTASAARPSCRSTARRATVAGDAITTDNNKCRLKPLDRARLQRRVHRRAVGADAGGVPGPASATSPSRASDQQADDPVADLPDRTGKVVYGGDAMGRAPRSRLLAK